MTTTQGEEQPHRLTTSIIATVINILRRLMGGAGHFPLLRWASGWFRRGLRGGQRKGKRWAIIQLSIS